MKIDGKQISHNIKNEIKQLISEQQITPVLTVIKVGDDEASAVYVRNKIKACNYVGIKSIAIDLPADTKQCELDNKIMQLNNDKTVNGILLQLPLPKGLDKNIALSLINADKDVDGLTDENMGKLVNGKDGLFACTPSGIMRMLYECKIELAGKNVVIINRSALVGLPLFHMLNNADATVTLCHSKTVNIKQYTLAADVIITAVGKPNFLTADMIKKDAVIIDVAINRVEGKLCGDADYDNVKNIASFITPVPGGVGPMTIAMLLENTLKAYYLQNK